MPGCLRTARHCVFTGGRLPPAGENRSCGKPPFLSAFPQGGFNPGGLWKTAARQIPVWKMQSRMQEQTVKIKEKPSPFFFIKGKMPTFLPRNFQNTAASITPRIDWLSTGCGKPGGKSGKHRWKLRRFFTKTVENPVEKVKSSCQRGNSIQFPVVILGLKTRMNAVLCPFFPHHGGFRVDFLECGGRSW